MSNPGTPLLVNVSISSFDSYIKSLSKHARKDWAYVKKHNQDLVYRKEDYNKPMVERFMDIWSRQTIHGNEEVRWGFDIGYVNNLHVEGRLSVFVARLEGEPISVHFIESHENFMECHPPMYDKKFSKRYLAKFMWFNLIKYQIEQTNNKWIDLGSGDRGNWQELIKNRKQYPRIAYKWMYVPDEVKKHPEKQEPLLIYGEELR